MGSEQPQAKSLHWEELGKARRGDSDHRRGVHKGCQARDCPPEDGQAWARDLREGDCMGQGPDQSLEAQAVSSSYTLYVCAGKERWPCPLARFLERHIMSLGTITQS